MKETCWLPQGKAMLDYWKGNHDVKLTIHSDEGKWEVPISVYFRDWEYFPELEQYALEMCRSTILDVGAGSGCHALALEDLGHKVCALDINPLAVSIMKKQGLKDVILQNIYEHSERQYDTVLMLMNGIGFVENLKGLKKFLHFAKKLIHPNGQLIFDSSDLAVENPGLLRSSKQEYYGIVDYQLEYNGEKGDPYQWLYVDSKTLNRFAKESGWHCQVVYDDMDGQYLARLRLI